MCVSEDWYINDEITTAKLDGYRLVEHFSRRDHSHGGVAIFCKEDSDVDAEPIEEISKMSVKMNFECAAIKFKSSIYKAFVYVSTAFSNCVHLDIKEEFYEPPLTPEKFFAVVNSLHEDILDEITPRLLENFPNTYVYSKNISEDLVKSAGESLPVAVVRPPIVTGIRHLYTRRARKVNVVL
ncbi:fatty acyl-CoA reductase 1-like isoform X2 [Zophobas morio]|uniref:fatty acyl-CoA reductase 1-like isoform X2 n=1 Tax=Zophobas morio TaxID=2755281 RepID=UPI003083E66E